MKIAFDAKRAFNNSSGLGNYARHLLNACMSGFPDNEYLLFTPRIQERFLNQIEGDFKMILPETTIQKSFHSLWRSYSVLAQLQKERVDIYHGLSNELPFGIERLSSASVVTIHDLIFLKHREQYPFIDRQIYKLKTKYAAKHAYKIVAVSRQTKHDLIKFYGIEEDKIVVIPPIIDSAFQREISQNERLQTLRKYAIPSKYILNVGSFFARKNQQTLIKAFDLIKDEIEEDLVLVGESGNQQKALHAHIQNRNLEKRVYIISGVSNKDLPAVYQGASVFVFPSLYEGFGMPIAEALHSRVPVVATKGGCFEEAGGAHTRYVNPLQADEIGDAIIQILKSPQQRFAMIENGFTHALTMTDKIITGKLMNLYKELT